MIFSLSEELIFFAELTRDIIRCLDSEEFDRLDDLLKKRQDIIASLNKGTYDNYEFQQICKELNIPALDSISTSVLEQKKDDLSLKISKLSSTKNTYNSYGKNNYVDSYFFNKKI